MPELLIPEGLAVAATATAAYLYYLADAASAAARAAAAQTSTTDPRRQPRRRSISKDARRIPRRTALLTPTLENTPAEIAARIRRTGLKDWALYWADGSRKLAEIADCLACETGREVTIQQVARFFEAHRDLGYVTLVHLDRMTTLTPQACESET